MYKKTLFPMLVQQKSTKKKKTEGKEVTKYLYKNKK